MTDSLDDWFPLLAGKSAANVNDRVFEWLSPIDRIKFEGYLSRLERALAWKIPTVGRPKFASQSKGRRLTVKERQSRDRGRKSAVVGRLFEKLLFVIFESGGAIVALRNVHTTTSEIDLLLQVQPVGARLIPMLHGSTHMIGEAKCHAKPPGGDLADELVGMLQKHNASIALLFVNCTSRELDSHCRFTIALHWGKGFKIIPLGRKQLDEVRKGAPFLRILHDQHLAAAVHSKLAV